MKTKKGRLYALIQGSMVTWVFGQSDLPEYNESDVEVVDITGMEPLPALGWRYAGGEFSEPAALSVEGLAFAERAWRDAQLAENQWLTARHRDELDLGEDSTLSAVEFDDLLRYRKALRDWPAAQAFPDSAGRPVSPAWLPAALTTS